MQAPRMVKAVMFAALVLVVNHARCVAACVAAPCTETQQPGCHHHKTPETKMDRGCAFPAANDAQVAPISHDLAAAEILVTPVLVLNAPQAQVLSDTTGGGGPPGGRSLSVLRI